jgi:predicted nucleotidyltransferase
MAEIPDKIKKSISSFLEEIQPICSLDKVFLYGSIVKGTAKKDSDIDLAIFTKSVNNINRHLIMTQIFKRISKYKLDIQPLVFSLEDYSKTDNTFVEQEIKNKGII